MKVSEKNTYNIVTFSMCNYVQVCHFVPVCVSMCRYVDRKDPEIPADDIPAYTCNTYAYLYIPAYNCIYLHIHANTCSHMRIPVEYLQIHVDTSTYMHIPHH